MAKILVIDDDAKDRNLIGAVLEERGYEGSSAKSIYVRNVAGR